MREFYVTAEVQVLVRIYDENVIDRCVNDEDGWRTQVFYPLDTEEKVIRHLAYNAISNGVINLNPLDGWADLPMEAATMDVVDVDFDVV